MLFTYPRLILVFSSLYFTLALSACGQKGPLYIQENNELPQVEFVYDENDNKAESNTSVIDSTKQKDTTKSKK